MFIFCTLLQRLYIFLIESMLILFNALVVKKQHVSLIQKITYISFLATKNWILHRNQEYCICILQQQSFELWNKIELPYENFSGDTDD